MEDNTTEKCAAIIGAGPAGLTAAYELLKHTDIIPIIFEESNNIGGIARTVLHNGNRMDIGGHRFFSKNEKIMQWWCDKFPLQRDISIDEFLVGNDTKINPFATHTHKTLNLFLIRRRVSRILYRNRFFKYPVEISFHTLKNIGLLNTAKVAFGFLYSQLFPRREKSLEDFYINHFGKPLYEMFFKNYTEKVWGKKPSELDADWGSQRINTLSLASIIKNFFAKHCTDISQKNVEKSLIERFLYPKYGPGQFWEDIALRIRRLGGVIVLNHKVVAINCTPDNNISSISVICEDGIQRDFQCNYVLSSMPIKDLISAIKGIHVPSEVASIAHNLPYRDFITIGVLVEKLALKNTTTIRTYNEQTPDTWIYIQQTGIKMGRLQIFNNWSPYLVKDFAHTIWLGLEYFCSEGDELWTKTDEQIKELAKQELIKIGVISNSEPILDTHIERVKKAYPAYFGSYQQLPHVVSWLDKIPNLFCIGRNGQHRYNNMDHSMMTAIEAVNTIVNGNVSHSNIWNVNTDRSYNEAK